MLTVAKFVTVVALASAIVGCAASATGPLTPVASPGPRTLVTFSYGPSTNWGPIIADAACNGRAVQFEGSGYKGFGHLSFWLQGAPQGFFPTQVSDGRVPGAVLVGEADVVNDHVSFERAFGPAIGPTEDGGLMTLSPGGTYGWVVVGDGEFSSYQAIQIPPRPCLAAAKTPRLAATPAPVCAGSAVTVTGDDFTPGAVTLQLWKAYQPAPGAFDTGKGPPQERELGEASADSTGHFVFAWHSDVEPGGKYILRALDNGRTRLTTLDLDVCR